MIGLRRRQEKEADATDKAQSAATTPGISARATTGTFLWRDLLVVTYAVPVERVRPHVPEGLALDMLPGPDGERVAFVQTLFGLHEDARWAVLPEGAGQSHHQVTHRILTRHEGRPSAFTLRSEVSAEQAQFTQRAVARGVDFARFSVYIAGDPARGTYQNYTVRVSSDLGPTQLEVKPLDEPPNPPPAPFARLDEMVAFLVQRPDGYFRASAPKTGIGIVRVAHETPAALVHGMLSSARVTLWTGLGVLTPDELLQPLSVLILPSLTVTASTPRYARLA